ncbi:MAG: hypothetical protein OHK0052_13240 [Anaerolineales bacterium]
MLGNSWKIQLGHTSIQYELISFPAKLRHFFPDPGRMLTVTDEHGHEYTAKMHSVHPRIDGLFRWYRAHPGLQVGDWVELTLLSPSHLRLVPLESRPEWAEVPPPPKPQPFPKINNMPTQNQPRKRRSRVRYAEKIERSLNETLQILRELKAQQDEACQEFTSRSAIETCEQALAALKDFERQLLRMQIQWQGLRKEHRDFPLNILDIDLDDLFEF